MDVYVVTPGDFVGHENGDLNSRRGHIRSQEMRGNATVIRADVPLANMFGYVSQLRSMSQGRALYTMQFAHYAEVPRNVAEEVKAKYAGERIMECPPRREPGRSEAKREERRQWPRRNSIVR